MNRSEHSSGRRSQIRIGLAAALAALVVAGVAPAAHADDYGEESAEEFDSATWPLRYTRRPLVLAKGMTEIKADFGVDLSKDVAFDVMYLSPSLMYGVSRQLTVGIDHELGLCLTGCDKTYNDIGLTALYSLMGKGSFQVAGQAGLRVPAFDPFAIGLNAGLDLRITAGNLAIRAEPLFYFGMTERDTVRKDVLAMPVWLELQVNEQTAAFIRTGINGPLSGFGDAFTVPVGIGAIFAVSNRIDFGGEFTFLNLAGKNGGADGRLFIARAAFRI
jgi:hypothetical protein